MKLLLKSSSELSTDIDHSVADHVDPLREKLTFAPPEKGVAFPNAGDMQVDPRSQQVAYGSF
jgi:hypothetical protein